mgnify:CR=1 FL=1
MNLSDGDFEFIFNLYDEATGFISDKDKPEFASKVILQLHDYGFDIKPAVKNKKNKMKIFLMNITKMMRAKNTNECMVS